jgi:hypothetical protein
VSRPAPPSGSPPPTTATLGPDERIELAPLAEEVARRYFEEFPGDFDRYGDVAHDWAVHDTLYILAWALGDLDGHRMLASQVDWLAGVLAARAFPLEQLARNLEIAADVLGGRVPGRREEIADLLTVAAESVRARG